MAAVLLGAIVSYSQLIASVKRFLPVGSCGAAIVVSNLLVLQEKEVDGFLEIPRLRALNDARGNGELPWAGSGWHSGRGLCVADARVWTTSAQASARKRLMLTPNWRYGIANCAVCLARRSALASQQEVANVVRRQDTDVEHFHAAILGLLLGLGADFVSHIRSQRLLV